jgi:gluconokinase
MRSRFRAPVLVLMGVAGCGKTTVGRLLARRVGCAFHDADDHHPAANVAKMRRGVPLGERDRAPWLSALRRLVASHAREGSPAVLACSALKERHRRRLRARRGAACFVQLRISPAAAARRLRRRRGHYFGAALVASQFAALEPPRGALVLPAASPPRRLAAQAARWWRGGASS